MLSICCNNHIKSWRNEKRSKGTTKIKSFINKYNWKEINFQSEKDDWRKKDYKNDETIGFNACWKKKKYIMLMF